MKKQVISVVAAAAAAMALAAPAMAEEKVSFTIFNSKNELQEILEDITAKYGEENNVDIEVYYSNDTVALTFPPYMHPAIRIH